MSRKPRTFIDNNLVVGRRHLLELLREPSTNNDPQVHVVMVAPTKVKAIATLDTLGLPDVRLVDLQVNETYLGAVTLRDAGLLTEGRAFVFRDYRVDSRVLELLGKDQAAVIGTFARSGGAWQAMTLDTMASDLL